MFRRILSLIKKEFIAIWADPRSRILIIVPPLLQLFIFAHAATMEVRNLHVAVLDKSNTLQSRELTADFANSRWFKKIIYVKDENELAKLIRQQKVQMGLSFNTDFATKLLAQKTADVQVIVDGRQTNVAAITNGYASEIIAQYEAKSFPKRYKSVPRINLEVRNWYNPNLIFLWYTVISLISILATTIALVLTALSIARERELGTFDQLIVSPLSSLEILIGKTVPPLIISIVLSSIMTLAATFAFQIPFTGSIWLFWMGMFFYLLSILGVGLFISSICKTQQQAILGAFTFQMPAILLSGFISPVEEMPIFFQYFTYVNPIRFFLVIMKGLFLKAMPLHDVAQNIIPLIFIAVLTLCVATWTFKRNLD
ncbi:MAG TPA: ABC transporter permease [Candidatus Gastranaerophilaceae bacterium]|mgnify:CR=1 FL=1|nr:ABC transporter permease [Candidatus Gastranaerophilaceae bacterium]HPT41794.1 ABC transporter permease [Candidatus Gastranaerophilaceae bacterium]